MRLKTVVADRLRERLLPAPERILPALPEPGLSDGRCRVRTYTDADAADRLVLEESAGMNLWRSAEARPMSTHEQATSWCRSQRDSIAARILPGALAIERVDTGAYLGDIVLLAVPRAFSTVELGVAMMPDVRGQSLGTRAIRLLFDWLLSPAGVRRIEANHSTANRVACIGASGVGLDKEGIKRSAFPVLDPEGHLRWDDLCCHAIVVGDPYRPGPATG